LGYADPRVLGGFSIAGPCHVRAVGLVVDDHHEALTCGVVTPGAGVVGAAEPVSVVSRNRWNITGYGTPEKSHCTYPCEMAGGSSLTKPWYDSSLVVTMRFLTARKWWPGRSSYASTSMLADDA
jgi:hypothetical protein